METVDRVNLLIRTLSLKKSWFSEMHGGIKETTLLNEEEIKKVKEQLLKLLGV